MTTQAADDRPDETASTEPPSAMPVAPAPDDKPAEPQPDAAPSAAQPGAAPTGDPKKRRRRRRRRRGGPRPPGGDAAAPDSAVQAVPNGDASPVPAEAAPIEAVSSVPSEGVPGAAPIGDQPRRRRRRRRKRPPTPDGTNVAPTADGAAPAGQNPIPERRPDARPRNQTGPERRPQGAGAGNRAPREFRSRDDRPRTENSGPRDRGGENKGPRGSKNRPFGKTRDAPWKKPEQKLYSFQSVVDRGFEDIADEAIAEATRRVEWTIVKRTVADQRRAKAVSAVYILQRDGAETEFANLAAARTAVSKTIVHPEKLTRPKGDYAKTGK